MQYEGGQVRSIYDRKTGRSLLAGPFLGEFGWELFCWQARLRQMSRSGEYQKTYVYCRPGHECLYEDFAEVNTVPPSVTAENSKDRTYRVIRANRRLVHYVKTWTREECEQNGFFDQQFVRLGKPVEGAPEIVVHARSRAHRKRANWPKHRYDALIRHYLALGFRVAVIGTQTDSLRFDYDGIVDYRGRPLRDVCDLLASAQVIVGTSSGPMHLAALCGCAQVVFTDDSNAERYRDHWNPFRVAARIPPGGWHPTVRDVIAETLELID
jgi:ADP-heptose:LPS heptosyltransferase